MHGYQPVEIVPTTALLLSHKHPEDHPHVARVLDRMINAAEPFSSKHRIVDTAGQVHQVVVVGDRLCYDTGAVIGTTGFYIDLTDSYRDEMKESVDEAVAELEQSRAIMEQAKGALMLIYGIPPTGHSTSSSGAPKRPTPGSASSRNCSSPDSASATPARVCAPSSITCCSPPTRAPGIRRRS